MKIKTIRNIYEKYEIKLSTSKTRNLNFVICNTDLGHALFEKMQSYFLLGRDGSMELDLIEERGYDARFMFVEEYLDYYDLLDYFAGMKFTGEFSEISGNANDIFNRITQEHKNGGGLDFLKIEKNHIMVPKSLSAAEATIAYYALLVAIIKRYRIDLPLIIEGFGRWGLKYGPLIVDLLAKNVSQVLIFTSDYNFSNPMHNYRTKKDILSVYDTVKNTTLGRAYVLNDKGVKKYDPFQYDDDDMP